MVFYIFAGLCLFITLVLIFEITIGAIDISWLAILMLLLIMCVLSTCLYYTSKLNNAAIKQITSETNISLITNFVFTKETANKIDNQAEKNATCTKDICVYTGTIQQSGPGFELTLLSQQNIIFECTVQNKCKLSSYVEHGNKYLKVSVN